MHEVAAIRGAIQTAIEHMEQAGAERIISIELTLGASGHLTEEGARQHFMVFAEGTPAQDATLVFKWIPATYQCFNCQHQFESLAPAEEVVCPACGGLALEIEHSHACYASAVEVAFAGDKTAAP